MLKAKYVFFLQYLQNIWLVLTSMSRCYQDAASCIEIVALCERLLESDVAR